MFKKSLTLLILCPAILSACAVAIKPGAEKIPVNKADPAPGCSELGTVKGSSSRNDVESVKNEMRNKALDLGANYIRMDTLSGVPGYTATVITGTAYKCS
jgi:hypothetical protein